MTRDEALTLAVKINQTFSGPPTDVWEEDLQLLDAGRAGTALARLRREHEHRWLSIAAFMAMYRSVNVEDQSTRPDDCDRCDSGGWIEGAPSILELGPDNSIEYTTVQPCNCPHGREAEQSTAWKYRTRNTEAA